MPTNDFKPFSTSGGANVITQAAYLALPAEATGFIAGTAISAQVNKVLRQGTFGTAIMGEMITSQLGVDALDDGDLAGKVALFMAAIVAAVQAAGVGPTTGDFKPTFKTAADTGWVMMLDRTIGNAASGATERANADTLALFTLLWNNLSNGVAPTFTSAGAPVARGGSAAADFGANRRIQVGTAAGRALAFAGSGAALTPRTFGAVFGEETHTLTESEIPPNFFKDYVSTGTPQGGSGTSQIENIGGGDPHNNMQPSTFVNVMIKL